ncbi:hypothetical protein Tco_1410231 [Tanacetum coccineum]
MANLMNQMQKALQERPQGALPSNTIPNPQEEIKVITTRSGIILVEPSVPLPPLSSFYKEPSPISRSSKLPSLVSLSSEPLKRNPHQPPIPYPSRLNKEKLQDKSDIQVYMFFQMFKKLHFNISLAEALALMPKYHKTLKDLLSDKENLLGLLNNSLTQNCSAALLKKLPEKLGDPGKFLIPSGITEDVFVQVGKFTFLADFVVFDYDVDPRVPLILRRPFLRTARFLVDHGNESINMITFIDITCEDRFEEVLKIQKFIHCLSSSPTLSDLVAESISPSPIPYKDSDSLVEETDTLLSHFNDSSPDYETFCFDIGEKTSGSTTSHSDHSLLDYEAFRFDVDHIEEKSSGSTASYSDHSLLDYEAFSFDVDHIEEKSSGSTTSHSDLSLIEYESFHFDLLVDSFPPIDRSDSHLEEFADELAHIISPPEYDRFYFDIEPDPGELTRGLEEIIYEDSTKELTSPELNDLRRLLFDYDSIFSKIGFSEIDLLVSFPSGNEDKDFNMIEKTMEVFMDDFSVFEDLFSSCLSHLDMMLKRCEDTNLVLNWGKCHFTVKEDIVLDHKIS